MGCVKSVFFFFKNFYQLVFLYILSDNTWKWSMSQGNTCLYLASIFEGAAKPLEFYFCQSACNICYVRFSEIHQMQQTLNYLCILRLGNRFISIFLQLSVSIIRVTYKFDIKMSKRKVAPY